MIMDIDRLKLKLLEVHFAFKFSKAWAEDNLTAKYTKCSFNPMSTLETAKYTELSMLGSVYLAVSEFILGKSP